jgi:ABC-type phosphate transport system substrate-binding protein
MNPFKTIYVSTILGILAMANTSHAEDVYVITHPSTNLSADDIKDVFVGEKQVASGTKLIPINNGSLKNAFVDKALHIDAAKYESIWTKKAFRDGLTAPTTKGGDSEVTNAVKSTPGTVGYVSKAPGNDVKLLKKF